MNTIDDEYMRSMLGTLRPYTVVILRRTQKRDEPGANEIVWEHGRRNFTLRRDGVLSIVGQVVLSKDDVSGICVFSTDVDDTRRIMDEDPAVRAGIFVYDIYLIDSFPGDALPLTTPKAGSQI